MLDKRWAEIVAVLKETPPGNISESEYFDVIAVLKKHWDHLAGGSETKMSSDKLDRIEKLSWRPPKLQFNIERHGGTQYGSSRALVYTWTVDIEQRRLSNCVNKIRQKNPSAAPLDCAPIVERVLNALRAGRFSNQPCEAVTWINEHEIRVAVSLLIPESFPKKTLEGRRKRFRRLLNVELRNIGWLPLKGAALRFRRQAG